MSEARHELPAAARAGVRVLSTIEHVVFFIIGVLLFLVVMPAMLFNIRRFRRER